MYAREIMTRHIMTIGPMATVKEAIQRLNRYGITSMPVVDDDDRLVGIVSEADLLRGEVLDGGRCTGMRTAPGRTRCRAWSAMS